MLGALLLAGALVGGAVPKALPARPAATATPIFRSYGVADGLPSATVYTITQDRAGYIWIGTHAGLARYDGSGFKVFRHLAEQPASLPANDVSTLLVDREGRLWVGGEDTGLNRFEPATGGFRHWLHDPAQPDSLGADDVWALAQDATGAIWVGTYAGGLARLSADGDDFTHWRHRDHDPASLASVNVTALAAAADGGLWIGTDAGLGRMDGDGHIRAVVLPDVDTQPTVWQVHTTDDGVDAATSAGLFHVGASGRASRVGAERETQASLRDADGSLWTAVRGGLERINPDGATRFEQPMPGVAGSLPGRLPFGLFQDREGGLWVALVDGGLAYLPPQWRAFSVYRHVPGDPASLAKDRARALALGGHDTLWVGGQGMLDRVDLTTGAVKHVVLPGLERMAITALAEDASGRLWIGNQHGCIVWDGQRLRPIAADAAAFRHGVWRLLTSGGSVYAAGVGTGVFRIDPEALTVEPIAAPDAEVAAQDVVQLRTAADGSVWMASHAGLARWATGDAGFSFVDGVAQGDVQAFAFGADGRALWIARADRLQQYRLEDGGAVLADEFGIAEGWPDTGVFGLQVDAQGRIVALGTRNLLAYDPHNRQLHALAPAGGLATIDYSGDALLAAPGGRLFAGSAAGVIGVRTGRLPWPLATPAVAVESVSVRRDGRLVRLDPAQPIDLDWRDRELAVTARVLSFIDPDRNAYRFRLQGFDPGWVDTALRNVREFSVLEPGGYRLLVSGRAGDGPWSAPLEAFTLRVAAAPWTRPAAWALYALMAFLVVGWIVWTSHRRLRQRHRLELSETRQHLAEQSNAAKSRFLADMAHEIRTPLTGVLGMTELMLKTRLNDRQHQYADAIRRSGALLMRQVNDALDVARIEAGRLELHLAPFDPAVILREVADADAGLAAQKQLAIDIAVAPDAPCAVRGDALRVKQILFNLTHNALKFTTRGRVVLKLERTDDGIAYRVVDNGPGMTPDECARIFRRFEQADHGRLQRGSGLGLAISRELVALMGGRIDVKSAPGHGSTFCVGLPLPAVSGRPAAAPGTAGAAATAVATPSRRARSKTSGRGVVLLVEDDPVAGQAIAGLIEAFGYTVKLAPQALAALSEIEAAGAFDAMVFDFDLPGMDGCELASLLRQRGVTTPIVALTAGAHGDEEQRARAAGMDVFLRKPALPEELREALERALDARADADHLRA